MSMENENDTSLSSNSSLAKESSSPHDNLTEIVSTDDTKTEPLPVQSNGTEVNNSEKPVTTASHSRRVHFPEDDSQLLMISYTSDPFSKHPLLSLGVILQRYRATCQRLQIRPISSLLDQLSKMDDGRKSFYDRLDCLKIVNEKIDLKHIDAMEEILSRCRFHTLDFDSSIIDDTALTQLFEVIEYYESCTHINLSNLRSIGIQGYQALTKYLRKTNSLERFDMNTTRFDDNSILSFTRSLRLSTTLYELHVESCQLNGKLLQKFIQNIRGCICLRELYLCDNRLQVQDSLLINELIRTCGSFLSLLDLRANSLHDGGMSHLASQLSHYDENHKHENNLHKISVQANQLTQQGVSFLAKALLHNRTIRSLNLSQNNITNEGLFLLRDALLTNRTLNELILRNCHLTDQAAIALAEFIAESSTIQYIDLRENNIQASGICGMAIAIKNNKSLLKLDFDPIASTPTNLGSFSVNNNNNNNIDRTANTNSFLSLTNLRKMTTGFSSFTSNAPTQPNIGGGGTRELLEQKARWMNDIAAVCQRNILIYEETLRVQEEEPNRETVNVTMKSNQKQSDIVKPEDIEVKEEILNTEKSAENEHSTTSIQNNNEETDPQHTSTEDTHEVEQLKNTSSEETEQSPDALLGNADDTTDQPMVTSTTNDHHETTPSIDNLVNTNDEVKQSADTSIINDTPVEQTTSTPIDDNHAIEQSVTDFIESSTDGDNQSSTILDSPPHSDYTEDHFADDQRKMHHSDSLYLLRKKVKNDIDDDTSDDESQISSHE